jgi:hypothetical protein
MAQINLRFSLGERPDLRYDEQPFPVIRLVVDVRFLLADGSLSKVYEGLIDTGAYICCLPRRIWRPLLREVIKPNVIFGGVKRTKACQVRADFGVVRGLLLDQQGNQTRPYSFPAFLAHTDHVPLLIGFARLLQYFHACFDYEAQEAWIKE